MSSRAAASLFAAGLLVRILALPLMGMDDMKAYTSWGENANARGLAAAYSGIYFPLQWQIFQVCASIAKATGVPGHAVVKACSLAFELAVLVLLAQLIRQDGRDPKTALLFWCHPTYLMFAVLGYIDAHFAVFVLLTAVLADRARSTTGFVLAGLPLAAAFLMKPQTQSLMVILFCYAALCAVRRRDTRFFALFLAPVALYVAYSIGLALGGRSLWALTLSYLEVASAMPSMTANHLNLWYPVAWLVAPTRPVYFVADTGPVLGNFTVRDVAMAGTVSLLAWFAFHLEAVRRRSDAVPRPGALVLLFAFASLTLPMVMTNAHENHFFVAGLFLVALLARASRPPERIALHVLLVLPGLNLLGLYGFGMNALTAHLESMRALRTPLVAVVGGEVAAIAFTIAAGFLFALAHGPEVATRLPRRIAPALLVAVVVLQTLTVAVLGSPVLRALGLQP